MTTSQVINRKKAAIIGASGYTGVELMRLIAGHSGLDLVAATGDSQAGTAVTSLYPNLAAHYPDLVFGDSNPETLAQQIDGVDVAFLGLPHEASLALAPTLVGKVGCVVDTSMPQSGSRLLSSSKLEIYPRQSRQR